MKLNTLDVHDRYTWTQKQDFGISQMCQQIIDSQPFGEHDFYIFAHAREIGMDEKLNLFAQGYYHDLSKIPSHRLIWQPRLTKPKAQTNSMLFRVQPKSDVVEILWIIPPEHLWEQYTHDKMMGNKLVSESIYKYKNNKEALEAKDSRDLSDQEIDQVYLEISKRAQKPNPMSPSSPLSTSQG